MLRSGTCYMMAVNQLGKALALSTEMIDQCIGHLWLLTDCRIEPSHVWLLSKLGISLLGIQVCALLPTCVSGQSLTGHPREPDLLVSLTTVCEEPGWELNTLVSGYTEIFQSVNVARTFWTMQEVPKYKLP